VTLAFPLGVAYDAWVRDRTNREASREEIEARAASRGEHPPPPLP
jgi:hypothetical protein